MGENELQSIDKFRKQMKQYCIWVFYIVFFGPILASSHIEKIVWANVW
jgi:hypothetical protein